MKKICPALITLLIFGATGATAQESAMPYPKKTAVSALPAATNGTAPESALPFPERRKPKGVHSQAVPAQDQIHSPVRWYAIENAEKPDYWRHVDTDLIWLELETGSELSDENIAAFTEKFDLTDPVSESMHPHLTKFYVFEKPGTTAEQIIAMAKAAREVPGIFFLEPSVIYKGHDIPNDPMWNLQWGPFAIFADEAWTYGAQGEGSLNVLAVLDDAIDWMHEDLYDQVWYGYDYGFNDWDPTPDDAVQTHGTHVAGIMSAGNNNGVGIAGMCADTVYFAKVTDNSYFTNNGSYSNAAIVNAIYDIASMERVFAINLSLGGGAPSSADEMAYIFAWNSGKFPIAASGNESNSQVSYPAAYPACMAVGAIGTNGEELYLASYSNYGTQQEVTAPGGDMATGYGIVSTMPGNQYEAMEGTSMACPHVAGLAGLMKSLAPELTNVEIRDMINSTCLDLGAPGWDNVYGYGMVNAKLALDMALGAGAVSTRNSEAELHLNLYPNPTADELWVQSKNRDANAVLQIFDLNGRLILSDRAVGNIFSVDVGHLPGGMYLVHLVGDEGYSTGRFLRVN